MIEPADLSSLQDSFKALFGGGVSRTVKIDIRYILAIESKHAAPLDQGDHLTAVLWLYCFQWVADPSPAQCLFIFSFIFLFWHLNAGLQSVEIERRVYKIAGGDMAEEAKGSQG